MSGYFRDLSVSFWKKKQCCQYKIGNLLIMIIQSVYCRKNKFNKETIEFYKKEVWRKMKFCQYSYIKKALIPF